MSTPHTGGENASQPEESDASAASAGTEQPRVSDAVSAALGEAARRAGLDPAQDVTTGRAVWAAIGGWRGILESVLPSLAFLVLYTLTTELLLSLGASVGLALVFTVVRLLSRSSVNAALGGLIAAAVAAALALLCGRFKKKNDTRRMAEANKAFAHYRW